MGRGLAKVIGSDIGKSLILLTNTVGGSLNALDLSVRGIFYSASKEFDDRALRIPISTARKLLRTDKVQTLVVVLDKTIHTDAVKKRFERLIEERKFDLEISTWRDMADFYNKTVELYGRQFFVLKLIIMIIVVLSIFNTINMAIWERTREIGTIMAMGYKRYDILKMFLTEGLILGMIGGALGIILGSFLAFIISLLNDMHSGHMGRGGKRSVPQSLHRCNSSSRLLHPSQYSLLCSSISGRGTLVIILITS